MELTQDQKDRIAELQKIADALHPGYVDVLAALYQMQGIFLRITAEQLQPLKLESDHNTQAGAAAPLD